MVAITNAHSPPMKSIMASVCVIALAAASRGDTADGDVVRFSRDIQPILADNCFKCHGPDASSQKAGLRLDLPEHALARLRGGRVAVVPGDAESSEMMRRIVSRDPAVRMPPPEAAKSLTVDEVELIRQWIESGAEWERHWAFECVRKPDLPRVPDGAWPRNEIDAFVLSRLEREGLSPSPEASRETILRRVALDLTGLPPVLAEIDTFLTDESEDAYERAVDRLLASPRFGERMAVPWLDAARYADSYGYQSDQLSPTWPYRDWVVRAFNSNLPYDQFITWQIAGDLLPGASREQHLATAFNRLHRMTNEGGSIEEEFRNEYACDRVNTFGTVFLGLTVECARCHDHKFDPISARDYYALAAFFNNIDEWGMYHDSSRVPTPSLLLPTPHQELRMTACEEAVRACNETVRRLPEARDEPFAAWLANAAIQADVWPGLVGCYTFEEIGGNGEIANRANPSNPGSTSAANRLVDGRRGHAIEFSGDDAASFPHVAGGLEPWDSFSVAFWIHLPEGLSNGVIFHKSGGTDVGRFGTELSLRDGRLFFGVIRFWPGNAMAVRSNQVVEQGAWHHVAVTYDGSGAACGMHLYLDGKAAAATVLVDRLTKSPGAGGHGVTFGERFRDAGLRGGRIDDLFVFDRAIAPIEAAQLCDGTTLDLAREARDAAAMREYYIAAIDPAAAEARAARANAVRALFETRDAMIETMVMEERKERRSTYVLARGAYDAAKTNENRVDPDTPGALSPFPENAPRHRLGLALWLTARENPLAARVAVNRVWQLFFGHGLVETIEDFGAQGVRPSHPELLDWLAADFMEHGWDIKRLCRQIATSATYRQASVLTENLRERDPENALLGRGPARRLPAEMIRDLALSAAGLLDETMGGPPVSPYQPAELWQEFNSMSPAYQQSVGTALYRRSLYTVWKRTTPMPNMTAFNAPAREVCTVRRAETSTPIQALVLLNDPQFVEAARALGERMLREGGATVEEQIEFAFRLLTGRSPLDQERALLVELTAEQRAHFAAEPGAGARLRSIGESPLDEGLDPIDAAAATVVAQAMLNMDATVWSR